MVLEYLRAVMQKRISFRSAEERKEGAERMVQEASQLRLLFRKLASVSVALALFPPGAVESIMGQSCQGLKDQCVLPVAGGSFKGVAPSLTGAALARLVLPPWAACPTFKASLLRICRTAPLWANPEPLAATWVTTFNRDVACIPSRCSAAVRTLSSRGLVRMQMDTVTPLWPSQKLLS